MVDLNILLYKSLLRYHNHLKWSKKGKNITNQPNLESKTMAFYMLRFVEYMKLDLFILKSVSRRKKQFRK